MTGATAIRSILSALFLSVLLAATACREPAPESLNEGAVGRQVTASITGTMTYRERIALTDWDEARVSLEDVSLQDTAATVLASQILPAPGQVPIRFELVYSPADIDERRSYALRATIHDRGRLLFTTDTNTPVLTRGAGREAHLVLVAVPRGTDTATASEADRSGEELEGMFTYFADAARFTDCHTGLDFPVSMEGAYRELESAYLDSGIEAGKPVMVHVRGRYLERPPMEGNRNEVHLVVDLFEELDQAATCSPSSVAELRNTYWKLSELGGQRVVTPEGMREVHLVLSPDDSSVRGHAGCNGFFGSFETAGDQLRFSALGSTMMACPEGMDTEKAFLGALGETTRFTIHGQVLTLFADDHPLARLEAVYK